MFVQNEREILSSKDLPLRPVPRPER
jgi:hypothetical protein